MATLETPPTSLKPSSPVPLDSIPISPNTENKDPNMAEDGKGGAKPENDNVTVFHDPENFNVKHPLMNEWTLWFTKPPSGKVYYGGNFMDRGLKS